MLKSYIFIIWHKCASVVCFLTYLLANAIFSVFFFPEFVFVHKSHRNILTSTERTRYPNELEKKFINQHSKVTSHAKRWVTWKSESKIFQNLEAMILRMNEIFDYYGEIQNPNLEISDCTYSITRVSVKQERKYS